MSQVEEDFETMCRVGYACGLQTVDEAFDNMSIHYDAFFLIEEAKHRLDFLNFYIDTKVGWGSNILTVMGDEWGDAEDRKEKAYWEAQQ